MIRKRNHNIFAYVFAPLGILILVGAGIWTIKQYDFVANSETAKGMVVELVRQKSDNGYTYAPLVEFVTNDNETVSFVSGLSSGIPLYREGGIVWVRYMKNDPYVAEIDR